MSSRHFSYYDNWKEVVLTCPSCGWSGTFNQGSVEYYEELADSSCPACEWADAPMLAIVSFPTLDETEANIDKLSVEEKSAFAERKQFLAEVEKTSLKSSDELPDIVEDEVVVSWEISEDQDGILWTTVVQGNQVIWSERAVYEGADRFVKVVDILRQKYGDRLLDVIPTVGSSMYLYGDRLSSIDLVKKARASLRRKTQI